MVGVVVQSSTLSGATNTIGAPSARSFIAGITERGRTATPKLVRSIVEYQTEYGGNQSWSASMFRAATAYFAEGGAELVVCRAVGTTPTLATLTSVDRTAVTPLPTLRWDGANAGAWATGLTVTVTAGAVANSVTISVFYLGVRVSYVQNMVDNASIVAAFANDVYIRATDLGAASVYPTRLPALITTQPLVGGADDRATVTIAKVVTALNLADLSYGTGAVATPGYNATIAGALLIAHCKTYMRVAILAGDVGSISTDLITMAAALTTDGEYAGVFGPWISQPEGSATVQVSPEGYVLGVRARAQNLVGFWAAPAGGRAASNFINGTVTSFDVPTIGALADGHVSGITSIAGRTMLYGWRSCSANISQFLMLNARDSTNTVTSLVQGVLQPYVFETIDGTGQLLARVKGALVGVLQPIADSGGFVAKYDAAGNITNPAYRVAVSTLSENSLAATVTFRLSGVAEEIDVSIIKAAFSAII